ncbi:transcriptional regulator [Calothrix sp. PCC 7716]|nr:transcriptional regulator [Calothrix sp. PCC 7716]
MYGIAWMRVTFSKEFPGLGKRIKDYRVLSNKSLTELAATAGISVPHWNRVENEKIQELPIATLRGIEKALGVDLGVKFDTETTNEA